MLRALPAMPSEAPIHFAGGPRVARTSLAQQFLGLFGIFLNAGPRPHRHTGKRASRNAQRRTQRQQSWTSRSGEGSEQASQHGSAVGMSSDLSPRSVHSATSDPSTLMTPVAPTPDLTADLAKSAETTAAKPVGKPRTSLKQRFLRLVTCGGVKAKDSDNDAYIEQTPVTAFCADDEAKETPVIDIREVEAAEQTPVIDLREVDAAEQTPVIDMREEATIPDTKTSVKTAPAAEPQTTSVVPLAPLKPSRCILEDDMVVEDFDEADFLLPSTSVSVPVTSAESLPSTPVPPPEPVAEPMPPLTVDPSPPVDPAPVDPAQKRPETPLRTKPRAPSVRPTEARLLPSIAAAPLPAWKQWQIKHLYQMKLVNLAPQQQTRRGRTVTWELDVVGSHPRVGRRGRKQKKKPKVTTHPNLDTDAHHNLAAMLEARDTEASKRRQEILNDRKFAMEERRRHFEKNERRQQRQHAERAAELSEKLERAESRRQELRDDVVQRCHSRLERVKSRCASRAATPSTLQTKDTACTTATTDDAPHSASSNTAPATDSFSHVQNHDERPVSSFFYAAEDDEELTKDVSLPPTPRSSPRDQPDAKSGSTELDHRAKSKSEGCFLSTQRSPNTKSNKSDGCVSHEVKDTKISLGAVGGIPHGATNQACDEDGKVEGSTKNAEDRRRPKVQQAW